MKPFIGLALVVLALAGCGGSGGGGSDPINPNPSPYAGRWSGTFSDQIPVNGSGTLTLNVTDDGAWTLNARNNTTARDVTGTGTISDSGVLAGQVQNANATASVTGTLELEGGTLSGAVILTTASGSNQLNVTLHR